MAYIGREPAYGAFEKQTLTADSSTTTFTLDYVVGSSSSILVSVAGILQEPIIAYGLANGGQSIVFSEAPTTGDTVFLVFLGVTMETLTVGAGVITSQNALTAGATADNLLIYDDSATALKKISLSTLFTDPLDVIGSTPTNIITDRSSLGELAADGDQLLIYDTSAGAIKKVNKSNIATVITYPTVTAISAVIPPSVATSVTITGTNFASDSTHVPIVEAVSSTNAYTRASVVSWTSATSISATFNLASGDYRVRVENPDGNAGMSTNAILQSSTAPTWTTAAGSLGSFAAEAAISETVAASSDSAITYARTSGSFPGGVTLATATGVISGTETGSSATTTYTFEITPTDAESQVGAAREFTMTVSHGATGGGQFN
jgi:hypothetical protein